jgi:hypothetical protein
MTYLHKYYINGFNLIIFRYSKMRKNTLLLNPICRQQQYLIYVLAHRNDQAIFILSA